MLTVRRSARNPLIAPVRSRAWEALAAFNPSAVIEGTITHVFYRALARPDVLLTPYAGSSTIGYAKCQGDASLGERRQVIVPSEEWDRYGCEDPRATFFEGQWYVFYTALGGYPFGADNIKVAVATGATPDQLHEKHLVTPFNAKAAMLFPERVNGKIALLLTAHTDSPPSTIAIAYADRMEEFWSPAFWQKWHADLPEHAIEDARRTKQDHLEAGAAPVLTPQGWLLIYSHIQGYFGGERVFGIEALLLDLANPQHILSHTEFPFLVPEESYEKYGIAPDIVFPTGATLSGDTLSVWYGAADTSCAVATMSLSDLLASMSAEKRAAFMTRSPQNPLLNPIPEHAWESKAVFNAAAVDLGGSVHLLYRAMGEDNTSVMGYARSEDGMSIVERLPEPVYLPRENFESKNGKPNGNSGCEDPRAIVVGDTVYLIYTAYDGVHETRAAISTVSTEDFLAHRFNWGAPTLITPGGVNDKDVCLFPELVGGKAIVMHRIDPNICIDQFAGFTFDRMTNRCIELMSPRPGMWDSEKIGAAGPPIRIPEGWLLIYHGIAADRGYRLGAVLLDSETATSVIARSAAPILEAARWEKEGQVPNVVFSCGAVLRDDTLFVYYGGADQSIGVATLSKTALLRTLLPGV